MFFELSSKNEKKIFLSKKWLFDIDTHMVFDIDTHMIFSVKFFFVIFTHKLKKTNFWRHFKSYFKLQQFFRFCRFFDTDGHQKAPMDTGIKPKAPMGHNVYLTGIDFRPPIPTSIDDPKPTQIGTVLLKFLGHRHRLFWFGNAPAQAYMDWHRTFGDGTL